MLQGGGNMCTHPAPQPTHAATPKRHQRHATAHSQTMRFNSAVDWWFYAALLLSAVICVAATVPATLAGELPIWLAIGINALGAGLPLWFLLATYYVVENGRLLIRCGPFRWQLAVADITKVERTRSPLSSPALSLKRLRITYGHHQQVMVSPKDDEGFLSALGHDAP